MIVYERIFWQIKRYLLKAVTVNLLSINRKKRQDNIVSLGLWCYRIVKLFICGNKKLYNKQSDNKLLNQNLSYSLNGNTNMKEFEEFKKYILSTNIPVGKKDGLSRLNSSLMDEDVFPTIEIKPIEQPILRDRIGTTFISTGLTQNNDFLSF